MNELKLNVEGMVCEGCEKRVVNAVGELAGVEKVIASYKDGTVMVKGNKFKENDVKEKIEDLGFDVKEN